MCGRTDGEEVVNQIVMVSGDGAALGADDHEEVGQAEKDLLRAAAEDDGFQGQGDVVDGILGFFEVEFGVKRGEQA